MEWFCREEACAGAVTGAVEASVQDSQTSAGDNRDAARQDRCLNKGNVGVRTYADLLRESLQADSQVRPRADEALPAQAGPTQDSISTAPQPATTKSTTPSPASPERLEVLHVQARFKTRQRHDRTPLPASSQPVHTTNRHHSSNSNSTPGQGHRPNTCATAPAVVGSTTGQVVTSAGRPLAENAKARQSAQAQRDPLSAQQQDQGIASDPSVQSNSVQCNSVRSNSLQSNSVQSNSGHPEPNGSSDEALDGVLQDLLLSGNRREFTTCIKVGCTLNAVRMPTVHYACLTACNCLYYAEPFCALAAAFPWAACAGGIYSSHDSSP